MNVARFRPHRRRAGKKPHHGGVWSISLNRFRTMLVHLKISKRSFPLSLRNISSFHSLLSLLARCKQWNSLKKCAERRSRWSEARSCIKFIYLTWHGAAERRDDFFYGCNMRHSTVAAAIWKNSQLLEVPWNKFHDDVCISLHSNYFHGIAQLDRFLLSLNSMWEYWALVGRIQESLRHCLA